MNSPVIRLMTESDIPFGMYLKGQAGWNQLETDWRRFLELQPDGCFVAEQAGEPVGTVATFVFGQVAWIAMMLVEESRRGQGIGRVLMEHALKTLDERGVVTVRLDATPLGQPLYERLGFVPCFGLSRYAGIVREGLPTHGPPPDTEPFGEELVDLDQRVTRTNRARLLRQLLEQSGAWTVREAGKLRGYLTLRPGSQAIQIGPCIADDTAGPRLISHALRLTAENNVYWDVPTNNRAATQLAVSAGLHIQRPLCRMNRGVPVIEEIDSLWASSGPAKG